MARFATRAKDARNKWADDPQVYVRRKRLQWLLQKRQITAPELARRIGAKKQTIQYLVSRKGAKPERGCRRSRLEKIADMLQVPPAFLTGDDATLPFQFYVAAPERKAQSREDSDDWPVFVEPFVRRCYIAFVRDLEEEARSAKDFDARLRKYSGKFVYAAYALVNPDTWRRALIKPRLGETFPPWFAWHLVAEQESEEEGAAPKTAEDFEDELAAAIVGTLEKVLQPWFDGRMRLDYTRIISWPSIRKGQTPQTRHIHVGPPR